MKLKIKGLLVLFLLLFLMSSSVFADEPTGEFYPAKVKDISDRAYEKAVIELLDNAKSSIVLSMYMLKAEEAGPVRLLVRDLEEALGRGVSVEIYLNTRPDHGMPPSDITAEPFNSLTEKGAKIYKFTPSTRLHDKLIIVDGRFVVDGSMNWSVTAIKSNYESSVLIDSPELAKAKLIRLRNFPLDGHNDKDKERPDRPKALEKLPTGTIIYVSAELISSKNYFAAMLEQQSSRAMNMYLLLVAESARVSEKGFFIPLEDLAFTLGISSEWSDTSMRRQMIKVLKALNDKYKLIDVNFSYGKDAWVELKDLPGKTFKVSGDFFDPANLASKSQPAKVVFLIRELLKSEGKSIDSASVNDLSGRFGISVFSIRKGIKELEPGILTTPDNQKIAYDHYNNGHKGVIIIAHGFYNSKDSILLKQLKNGLIDSYDVIMFDFRGHGKSSGLYNWTSRESLDLKAVLDYAKTKYSKIGLIGFSLGGSTSIAVCTESNIVNSLVVASSPSQFDKLDYRFWELSLENDIVGNLGKGGTGKGVRPGPFWLDKPKPIDLVGKITCPVLYIHGTKDWVIDHEHSSKLYRRTKAKKEIKIFKNGQHAEYLLKTNPKEFIAIVKAWFNKTLTQKE